IFAFSRNVDLTPAGTRSENHGTALEHATIFKFDFHDLAGLELDCALQIHDVDIVCLHMLFKRRGKTGTFSFLHRNEVLDGHGVQNLTAEAFGNHTRTVTLACSIHSRSSTSRAAADDQHVKHVLGTDFFGLARRGRSVQLGENFLDTGTTLPKYFTVHEYRRYSHDLAVLNFLLEQCTIN